MVDDPFTPTWEEQQEISNLVCELRLANGQSHFDVAGACGLPEQTIVRIEEGRQPLSAVSTFDLLNKLANTEEDWVRIHQLITKVPSLQREWESRKKLDREGRFPLSELAIRTEGVLTSKERE